MTPSCDPDRSCGKVRLVFDNGKDSQIVFMPFYVSPQLKEEKQRNVPGASSRHDGRIFCLGMGHRCLSLPLVPDTRKPKAPAKVWDMN